MSHQKVWVDKTTAGLEGPVGIGVVSYSANIYFTCETHPDRTTL